MAGKRFYSSNAMPYRKKARTSYSKVSDGVSKGLGFTTDSRKFTKAVLKIIHRDTEKKHAAIQADNVAFNSGISVSGDCFQLIPNIVQGVDQADRIGDYIKAVKLVVRGHIELTNIPTTATQALQASGFFFPNSRVCVRMMIIQPKSYLQYSTAVTNYANWMTQLLNYGDINIAFAGNTKDLYLDPNLETIDVLYDKKMFLNIAQQFIPTITGTTVVPTNGTVKFFETTIDLKSKNLKYDDYNNLPNNFAPILIVGYAHIDGSTPDTVTTACNLSYVSQLEFIDV